MYATTQQLVDWLGEATTAPGEPEATRLLTRAKTVVDAMVTSPYATDGAGAATEATVITALQEASCAQVEYWLEVGEDVDLVQVQGAISAAGATLPHQPGPYSPRALRILQQAGLRRGPVMA